jgi:hypothetical protein
VNVERGHNYCHIYLKKGIILIDIILTEKVKSFMILFTPLRFMNYFQIQKSIISLCPRHVLCDILSLLCYLIRLLHQSKN